jgi:phosphatidylglycerol:prolipoprotein diacylglycerol transferase
MIPYIKIPDLHIAGPVTLHPFGILVATGVLVGTWIAGKRAKRLGYDDALFNSFVTWMLVGGFLGGHMLDELFYHWDEFLKRPYSLLLPWEGLSSFGGFIGALVGILLWKRLEWKNGLHVRKNVLPVYPFADVVLAVFPVAWIFGRSGCSVVHDHRGAKAPVDAILAVAYPFDEHNFTEKFDKIGPIQLVHGSVPRWDLGLLELLFTCIIAVFFVITWKRKLPIGTYVIVTAFAYAPVRFVMDFLRVPESEGGDTRYAHLTPAQWCCTALFIFGVGALLYTLRLKKAGGDPAEHLRAAPALSKKELAPDAPLVR